MCEIVKYGVFSSLVTAKMMVNHLALGGIIETARPAADFRVVKPLVGSKVGTGTGSLGTCGPRAAGRATIITNIIDRLVRTSQI